MNITSSEERLMKALQKKLEQCEKTELIAIIQQMLRQEPDVQWLLTTPLPTSGAQEVSLDPEVYRQQVLAAMAAGDQPRHRKRHEVERRLTAIKAIADGFVKQQHYAAALTIYEVLITQIIAHYYDYQDEYIAFSVMLRNERSLQPGSVMRLLLSSQPGRPDGVVGPIAWHTRH
jgi:hypothetical protein